MKIYAVAFNGYEDYGNGWYEHTETDTEALYLHREDCQRVVDDLNESKRVALWQTALTQERIRIDSLNRAAPEYNALVDAGFRQTRREILPIPTLADIPAPTLTRNTGYWTIEELEVKE